MATRMAEHIFAVLPELRIHPTEKRLRAYVGDTVVVDSRSALIVWEPRRVVPSYAVPVSDIAGELVTFTGMAAAEHPVLLSSDTRPVLDPSTPFSAHSCPGEALSIRTTAGVLEGAAFSPADADLHGYAVLDWNAFSRWNEEEQLVLGHPHDPFDRIDCLLSSRHIVVSIDGTVLADSASPILLFETPLPTRYYLPRSDVRMDLLQATSTESICAYKGVASYWSAVVGDQIHPDIGWSYEAPLHDAVPVQGRIAFFTERLDISLDGVALKRPVTPWS